MDLFSTGPQYRHTGPVPVENRSVAPILYRPAERCQTIKGQFGECYLADGRIQFLDIFGSWSFGRMFYHLTNIYCTIWTNGRILFYHSTMCPSYAQSLDKWKSSISFIWSIFCYLLSHFAKTVCPMGIQMGPKCGRLRIWIPGNIIM